MFHAAVIKTTNNPVKIINAFNPLKSREFKDLSTVLTAYYNQGF